jgi:hypothetical protein
MNFPARNFAQKQFVGAKVFQNFDVFMVEPAKPLAFRASHTKRATSEHTAIPPLPCHFPPQHAEPPFDRQTIIL